MGYAFNVEDKVWAGALHLGRGSGRKGSDTQAQRREHPGLRFVRFHDWLEAIPKEMPLDAVVMEAPFMGGFYASFGLAGLKAYVREFCCRRELPPPRDVAATSLKKWTTGYGRASKEDMMKAVKEKWGWEAASDDEADAVALLNWGIANMPCPGCSYSPCVCAGTARIVAGALAWLDRQERLTAPSPVGQAESVAVPRDPQGESGPRT